MQNDRNIVGYQSGGAFWASNTNISDITLKKDITTLDNALDKILQLRGVNFFWKDAWRGEGSQVGLVAQEVEKVFPEVVSTFDKSGLKGVQYDRLVAPLIEAVKEQQKEISEQGALIKKLQEEIDILKTK